MPTDPTPLAQRLRDIAVRLDGQANISARPGQLADLEAIAGRPDRTGPRDSGGEVTDSLAQSLVEAAAEEARAAFFASMRGYVAMVDGQEHAFAPEEIKLVFAGEDFWQQVAVAALSVAPAAAPALARRVLFDHADRLMAAAADLYKAAPDLRVPQ